MTDEYINRVSEAVSAAGGPVKVARITEAPSYQAVQQWIATGQVPPEYCKKLEMASGISRLYLNKKATAIWPELARKKAA